MAKKLTEHDLRRKREALRFLLEHVEVDDPVEGGAEPAEAFPGGATGKVAAVNGLYRTNWFDGRYLTADALRADQVYADTRARMVAQIHPPGVAWGLTLTPEAPIAPAPTGDTARPPNPLAGTNFEGRLEHLCETYHRVKSDPERVQGLRGSVENFQVSWDDFLAWCDPQVTPVASGGADVGTRVTLAPGLAFDDLGRPASVGAPFTFRFTDLVNRYRTRPTRVVGGGTMFAPCACVESLPPGSVPAGPSLPEGPYLLLIFPIETGEGKAKVYGDACAAAGSAEACAAEGWRGGFELRLARLDVQVPRERWSGAWDLRGMLAAWYFDLYEHDLRSRWNRLGAGAPYFPGDPEVWRGPGPSGRVEAGVPLALVYLGSDGSVLFLDEWIPRRPLVATGAAAWAANARGAPTPAARVARRHQFQTMLVDSLAVAPQFGDKVKPRNLYDRGFRHIPPWGFLPVPEAPPLTGGKHPLQLVLYSEAQAVEAAKAAASTWFAGTNVVPLFHVAIHDDDVLEEVAKADEKDPVSLRPRDKGRLTQALFTCLSKVEGDNGAVLLFRLLMRLLAGVAGRFGDLTVEQLVNREVEVVKVILPMEPRRRSFPIVGRVDEDPLAGLFTAWSSLSTTEAAARQYDRWLGDVFGTAAAPRRWVFYVKQRMVLLDSLYLILDFVLDLLAMIEAVFPQYIERCVGKGFGRDTSGSTANADHSHLSGVVRVARAGPEGERVIDPTGGEAAAEGTAEGAGAAEGAAGSAVAAAMLANAFLPVRDRTPGVAALELEQLRSLAAPLRARVADGARAVLALSGAREIAVDALRASFPELGLPGTWSAWSREARAGGGTAAGLSALATEFRGFGVLKALSLVLPDAETEALVGALSQVKAPKGQGKLGAAAPLVTNAFYAGGFASRPEAESVALADLRAAYGEKPATDLEERAPAATRVEDLLAGTADDAARTVGRAQAAKVVSKIAADARSLGEAAKKLADAPAARTEAFWAEVEGARAEGGALAEALAVVAKSGTAPAKAAASALAKAAPALGEDGLQALAARLRRSGGA